MTDFRDRAIVKTFLYSGIRLGPACRLKVSDLHQDGDETTLRLHEKGDKRRTIGLHFTAAQAINEYLSKAALTSGFLFRPRLGPRRQQLANRAFESSGLYLLLQAYLEQLPGSLVSGKEEQLVADDRASHRSSELVLTKRRFARPFRLLKK